MMMSIYAMLFFVIVTIIATMFWIKATKSDNKEDIKQFINKFQSVFFWGTIATAIAFALYFG